MCKGCVKAVEDYFPDCPDKEYGDFLMAATVFPFGDFTTVRSQLKEAKDAGCKTYREAIRYAETQLDDQMRNLKTLEHKKNKSIIQP